MDEPPWLRYVAGPLIWIGLGLALAVVGTVAARRLARAVRASDDTVGLDPLLRRHVGPEAERWRRLTLLAWAGALAALGIPLLVRGMDRGLGSLTGSFIPDLFTYVALIAATFWAVQLVQSIVDRRRRLRFLTRVAGIVACLSVALFASSWRPPGAPAELIIRNSRDAPVIVELADGRAWVIPPDGWGPTVVVKPGTMATIYTADCEPIEDVVFERGAGFIVNADDVIEYPFSHIITTTVTHPGCT